MQNVVRKNKLLAELRDGKVTTDEFLKKCAEWVAEDVETYTVMPMPVAPKDVEDYERIPVNVRANIDAQYFYDHPQILAYYNLVKLTYWENKNLYDWLKECMHRVETEEEKAKIAKKMAELTKAL
jgi:hypothetical protein